MSCAEHPLALVRRARGERTFGSGAVGLLLVLLVACGGGGGGDPSPGTGTGGEDENVLALSVNGDACGGRDAYLNQPCVRVTVCEPGTQVCRTIDRVLLDTGSFGLRLFRQSLAGLALGQVSAPDGGALASCTQFADLSADWGPVQVADVVLGGEPPVQVPIQVIDAGFGPPPESCPEPESGPADAGFDGILGVGVFREECGPPCEAIPDNGLYFSCDARGCHGTRVPLEDQVQNPVAHLPADNNGVIVELPGVDPAGARTVEGRVLLGIGTRPNNAVTGATALPLDRRSATFTTTLEGRELPGSFIDTGSNGLFFPDPPSRPIPTCPAPASVWYCPDGFVAFSATTIGFGGAPSVAVPFEVGNFRAMIDSDNRVLPALGGDAIAGAGFDWGLPFFLGKTVAVGFEGTSSPLGEGPYVAW